MSNHLRQVNHLYGNERKKWLGRARFSISHTHCSGSLPGRPTLTVEEMCSQENLFCTTTNKSRAGSNSIYANQTLYGIQHSP